ncbi:ABC transporter G family member 1-like [Magnolia sinica]|uniref:ABC transporter G family member 1-like n=1 Tax=Magnolia sinica TaxID=86752 RepID=UPI00265A77F7|nr:ABC transporter G family member 1-like [Magnolia sinica]
MASSVNPNVPRWTANSSPKGPPGHGPVAPVPEDDIEMDSFTSQDNIALPASATINIPRWTPTPSPTKDERGMNSFDSQEDMSYSAEGFFPFSTAASSTLPHPHPPQVRDNLSRPIYNAASLRVDMEIKGTGEAETMTVPTQEEVKPVNWDTIQLVSEDNGIFLTWEDLWVTASNGKAGSIGILQGLTGYAQPGEVLAIMGPSGCGKSTLLDALAGRLGSNTRQSGEILINGRKQTLAFGTSAYVTQDDTLMTTLTVREAVYYSAQLQLPDSMPRWEKRERAETTIREMGLQDAMNTRIGGWATKGLSGGQKRRVSICIEMLTRPKLLYLDEPTSGLDSAASYHVMNRIVGLARRGGRTIIASIHQPSGEVFELFNNLCLLSAGRTVYFGPASEANEFFALNGFPCPSLMNPSDHFLRTINKDFDKDIEQGPGKKSTAEAIDILVKSYKSSPTSKQVSQRVAQICKIEGGALEKKGSQASFLSQSLVLARRSFVNMYRDLGYYWLRFAIYIALCLCVGTIYYNIGKSFGSIQARGSMLMFVASFLTFMAIGGFPSFVEDMKIFGRERLNGHYGVGAYVVGNTISSIPYLFLISIVPGAIAYFLVGLQRGADHFIYFTLVLFACTTLVESLMMIVASIVPDFLMGIITGAGIQGVMMLNGGFFRLPDDLPKPFWKYPMYYIAFHKYAFQGFYKNEFIGLTFPNNQAGGLPTISGDEILRSTWQVEMGYSKWVDLGILIGMVILYRVMFLGIIKMAEKVKPMIRALLAGSPKQTIQVMEQPYTPTH